MMASYDQSNEPAQHIANADFATTSNRGAPSFPVHSALDISAGAWDESREERANQKCGISAQMGSARDLSEIKKKMKISGAQITAARDLLRITQVELAEASGVGERTLGKFESDEAIPKESTVDKLRAELERRGIEFTNGDGAGVRINYAKAAEFARKAAQPRNAADL